jgi:tetratricopeptide (TPR) repeat protein
LEVGMPFKMAFHATTSNVGLAQILLWQGQTEAAWQTITASLKEAQMLGAKDLVAEIHQIQAQILQAQGTWDEARAIAEQSASLAAEIRNRSLEAAAWRVVSETELERDDIPAAREALVKAQDTLADVTDELLSGRISALAGRLHLHEGNFEEAEHDLRVAREILSRLGASLDLREVQDALRRVARPEREGVWELLAD